MFYVVQSPCWSGSLALAHVHYSLDRVDDELPWVGNHEQLITVTNSIFSFSTMLLSQRLREIQGKQLHNFLDVTFL